MSDSNKMDIEYFAKKIIENPESQKDVLSKAMRHLSDEEMSLLKKLITKEQKVENSKSKREDKGKENENENLSDNNKTPMSADDKELEKFWDELERLDVTTLIDDKIINDFEYKGFDPDKLIKSIIAKGKKAGRSTSQIKKDLVSLVTIAVIKGSMTDKNIQKLSENGKQTYQEFEKIYDLQKGGSKGRNSDVITVSRIAAALPGLVMKVLQNKSNLAKKFVGPFGSSSLPYYLRHQASAACLPSYLPERLNSFLLGLITAFTADQSKVISGSKIDALDLFSKQETFVGTTFNSDHPNDSSRRQIFKGFTLESDYESLRIVAEKIKKIKPDFVILTLDQINQDLSSA